MHEHRVRHMSMSSFEKLERTGGVYIEIIEGARCRECLPEWELQAARPVPSVMTLVMMTCDGTAGPLPHDYLPNTMYCP